ncbi:MAG: type 4a pilus biogenesis protein PilO [Selenomonadaceae bacterium]|nr:type 4a pilus biogenesis protein PilO [Selenomonadaceae bacterium]
MSFNKTTLAVSLFFCVILEVLFWQFAHKYAQQKILQLDLERQKLSQISTNILNYKNKYGNLDEYMQRLEERFQLSNKILPERMNQGEFVDFLQKMALENQIKIISLTPGSIQPVYDNSKTNLDSENTEKVADNQERNLIKLPIGIKLESSYISLIKFLESMESSERLMHIEEVSITSEDDGEWLNCSLNITIFALKN